MPRHSKLTSAN